MSIFIYNSLTREKKKFTPLNPPKVNIYTCGVTVYDESHIGHARSLYTFDVIRRYLTYRKFKVKFVRNITDIDDKIINRAAELKVDWKNLVKKYIQRYHQDLEALGIPKGDCEPRATENIKDMIKYISALIDKGYAYEAGGDVYFNVRKFSDYGKLSGQSIDQMQTGARIEPTEFKKDPLDFALWKKSKPNEPVWASPWGDGRPGWHIECSVMSQKFLKTDTLDIHAGGRDLIFPHHENEIAQGEAKTGKLFAKYWIHHGLLTINGQKMAKSLGNFVTISDFIKKYGNADILKLFFLSAHYSQPIDYNQQKLEEVKKQKAVFDEFFERTASWVETKPSTSILDKEKIDKLCQEFENAMDGDFNTAIGLACLFKLKDLGYKYISSDEGKTFKYIKSKIEIFFKIFGLNVPARKRYRKNIRKSRSKFIKARKNKDYKRSDEIRQELKEDGFSISNTGTSATIFTVTDNRSTEDTKDGKTTWRRKL